MKNLYILIFDDQRAFRVKVLTTFLKAGVKLETFRELFEESGLRLTSTSSLMLLSLMSVKIKQNRLRFGAKEHCQKEKFWQNSASPI